MEKPNCFRLQRPRLLPPEAPRRAQVKEVETSGQHVSGNYYGWLQNATSTWLQRGPQKLLRVCLRESEALGTPPFDRCCWHA